MQRRVIRRIAWAVLATVALSTTIFAYINGGDFHSTLKNYQASLESEGWKVSTAQPAIDAKLVATGVKVDPVDNPDYQRYVNQLFSRSLTILLKTDADRIPEEARREAILAARETIRVGVSERRQTIKEGRSGQLQYRVGVLSFESYWETNYGGKREIHAKRSGLAPFIALKVVSGR